MARPIMAGKGATRRQFALGVAASAALAGSAAAEQRTSVPGSCGAALSRGDEVPRPVRSRLAREIAKWMARENVPGLGLCIAKGNRIVCQNGFGLANMTKRIPFNPGQTLFHVASVSKTITATAVMQLRDKGLFDLDEDVGEYLSFPVHNPRHFGQPITFRHLLTHMSSINDSDALYSMYAAGDPVMSLQEVITRYFTTSGSLWSRTNYARSAPGANVRYSNAGFALLGYLVEVIGEQPLEEYLQKNVYRVLNMNETSFYIAKLDPERHGRPYTHVGRITDPLCPGDGDGNLLPTGIAPKVGYNEHALYSYPTLADGMVRTSISQLSNFMIAMMNRGQFGQAQLLRQETVDEMLGGCGRGLGWFKSGSYWGHDGGDPGCSSELLLDPRKKTGVIIVANADVDLKPVKSLLVAEAEQGTV
jgi:CubicO group peptidase (beta-lactamase class C family)